MRPSGGLLLVDKPSGPTSHDIVAAVRRGTGQKRVGHAGTLDPLATGLLVVCLAGATRLSEYLAGKDKRYHARVRLGQTTTTYDAQGDITAESADLPDREAVERVLPEFRGQVQQVPPQFSAIKRGGQKAYNVARRGEHLELEARRVNILELELITWEPPYLELNVHCSAGTYIRSLAHDLGQRLNCGAHLAALRRTASGHLEVAAAIPLDELKAAMAASRWEGHVMPADQAVADWPAVHLSAAAEGRLRLGQPIPLAGEADGLGRAYNPAGDFVAILRADRAAGLWWPHKVFAEA